MSFVKNKLKAARDALTKKDYLTASEASSAVLEYEPENYNANVFLGLSLLELGNHDESEQAYRRAIDSSPEQPLAWQGLSKFYERTSNWTRYDDTLSRLIDIYNKAGDPVKCAETWQKLVELRREKSSKPEIAEALSLLLPHTPLHTLLSTLPPPNPSEPLATTTFKAQAAIHASLELLIEIIHLIQEYETDYIRREVEKRRTRLGARGPEVIKKEVGQEVWGSSKLPFYFNEILNHPNTSDELRRTTEADLLEYRKRHLFAIPNTSENENQKAAIRSDIDKMVEGMILLHVPDESAWRFYLESQDNDTILSYPTALIWEFIRLFPSSPLACILRGFYTYVGEQEEDNPTLLNSGNDLDHLIDTYSSEQDSLLATRAILEIYLNEMDYENVEKVAKGGLELVKRTLTDTGRTLSRVTKQLKVALATALVHIFPPKHHTQALQIVDVILEEDPDNIACLMNRGYIMQSSGKWNEAESLFAKATKLTGSNTPEALRAAEEHAWCLCHIGKADEGVSSLRDTLAILQELEDHSEDVARCTWRIGNSFWEMEGSKREEAYGLFIAALKANPSFAPAFTSLGRYYAEFSSPPDSSRASKCFQKAFELDPRETEAARRLAEGFADEREWDLVEVVARRTIEGEGAQVGGAGSIAARYIPQNAWAWKAMGAVEYHRQNYDSAIHAFQLTLRACPEDAISWLRLGEAYNRAGRHTAAIKALNRAKELQPDDWMSLYLIGEVKLHMGLYLEAIEALSTVLHAQTSETGVLLSLGQAYLDQGRSELADGFRFRGEYSLLNATNVGLRVLQDSPGFRVVAWKLIGDSIFSLSGASHFADEPRVHETLVKVSDLLPDKSQNLPELMLQLPAQPLTACHGLRVASAVYNHRATLASGETGVSRNGSGWYDLGMCLQAWSLRYPDDAKAVVEGKIVDLLTKALQEDSGNNIYWAALGDAHFVEKPKVAQHAYIKSLECDSKAVSTWTKLGLLYLHYNDVELANEAFHRAQTLDPDSAGAWIGQAIVATLNNHHYDATAMFQHSVTLAGNLPQGDLEFAIRSFKRVNGLGSYDPGVRLDILLPTFHVLDRYIKTCPEDATGLHLFALVCEGLGHPELGARLASKAITILEAAYEETEDSETEMRYTIANMTLGRLLTSLQQYPEACDVFETASGLLASAEETDNRPSAMTLRAQAQLGLGLASFMAGDLHRALMTLESALETTNTDTRIRGQLTVLLAKTMWAIGAVETRESAKNLLLECITIDPENILAVNTLAGMGVLTDDDNLVDAALSELLSLPIQQRLELDPEREVDYLLIQYHLGQGEYDKALSVAQKALHSDSANAAVRNGLATLLLQGRENVSARAVLNSYNSSDLLALPTTLRLKSVADEGDQGGSLRDLQRAIRLAPWEAENWQALAYITSRSE